MAGFLVGSRREPPPQSQKVSVGGHAGPAPWGLKKKPDWDQKESKSKHRKPEVFFPALIFESIWLSENQFDIPQVAAASE